MRIIDAGAEVLRPNLCDPASIEAVYRAIETAGRTCYKSESRICEGSARRFVAGIVKNHHDAMLEHANMTVRFTVDRGISHEIVRHRIASYAQESSRYCNYAQEKFNSEITVIRPCFFVEDSESWNIWKKACEDAEDAYFALLGAGNSPEQCRDVLPTSVKTEIVVTMNMREWRHFFKLRAAGETGTPHPQMVEIALPLLNQVKEAMPELFGDINPK